MAEVQSYEKDQSYDKSYVVLHLVINRDHEKDKEIRKVEAVMCKTLKKAEKILNGSYKKLVKAFEETYSEDWADECPINLERKHDAWALAFQEDAEGEFMAIKEVETGTSSLIDSVTNDGIEDFGGDTRFDAYKAVMADYSLFEYVEEEFGRLSKYVNDEFDYFADGGFKEVAC